MRNLQGIGVAIVALALGIGQPAIASTDLGHWGEVGRHWLHDDPRDVAPPPGRYGASCEYGETDEGDWLQRLVVRPPVVRAMDRTPGTDRQKVGWRARLRARTGVSGPWTTIDARPMVTATATDGAPASFRPMAFSVRDPWLRGLWFRYLELRVFVDVFWFGKGDELVGGASSRVDWYKDALVFEVLGDGDVTRVIGRHMCITSSG